MTLSCTVEYTSMHDGRQGTDDDDEVVLRLREPVVSQGSACFFCKGPDGILGFVERT